MKWQPVAFDWNRARAFLAAAEEGSFSAAARVLDTTQPTVGRQVAALEEELKAEAEHAAQAPTAVLQAEHRWHEGVHRRAMGLREGLGDELFQSLPSRLVVRALHQAEAPRRARGHRVRFRESIHHARLDGAAPPDPSPRRETARPATTMLLAAPEMDDLSVTYDRR